VTFQQLTLENKPLEDIKPYRWITLDEQKQFCGFLEKIRINFDKLTWCASEFEKYRCSSDYSHTKKIHYIPCGMRGICPRCSMTYAHKRAEIMYQWIKINLADKLDFDLKINQIVLTLPEELHDIDQKLFSKMVRKFMSKFGIEAYCYSIQNRHSRDPLAEKYTHVHILSLNIKNENDRLVENEYYFDVDKMRKLWQGMIEKYAKCVIEGSVNLHTEYASILRNKNRVVHLFSYLYRYPIEDLFHVQIRSGSLDYVQFLQFEKSDDPNYILQIEAMRKRVMSLIEESKPRIVWCGLLTSTKRKLLIHLVGMSESFWLNLPDIEKMIDERSKQCRDCGSPYEKEPFERGKYAGDNEPDVFSFSENS